MNEAEVFKYQETKIPYQFFLQKHFLSKYNWSPLKKKRNLINVLPQYCHIPLFPQIPYLI